MSIGIDQTEKEMQLAFGIRLRQLRGERSREAFAQKIGVSSSAINNYENGRRSPDLSFILRLFLIECVMPSWITVGSGSPYEEGALCRNTISEPYTERDLVTNILNEMNITLTDKQRDAVAAIISEELRRKVKAIATAILE